MQCPDRLGTYARFAAMGRAWYTVRKLAWDSLQALMQTVMQRAQLPLLCRLSWHPSCLRPSTVHGRHLREQVLQVLAHFAPFWPLENLRLSQVIQYDG